MKPRYLVILATISTLALGACQPVAQTAADKENLQTQQITEQMLTVVGMPSIRNYTEKKQLKTIYELRDTAGLVTYTYTTDMNGKLHNVCPKNSIGFPIPYSTQYTAPTAMTRWYLPATSDGRPINYGTREAPLPEPNGLHMPASADATWVICSDPVDASPKPTYIEDKVRTYLFKVQE